MMQMSKATLFGFVEGFSDRYIYSRLLDVECQAGGTKFQVVTAEELSGASGGKNALFQFFNYSKRAGLLWSDFQGKKTACLFFLDKDIDDVTRRKRRSAHVVYTQTYDMEGTLFRNGDIVHATAAAAYLDIATTRAVLGSSTSWCERAARAWEPWLKLCIFASIYAPSAGSYYGRPSSQINTMPFSSVDTTKLATHEAALRAASGLSSDDFVRRYNRVGKLIRDAFLLGNHDRLFRGKWYPVLLKDSAQQIAAGRKINVSNFDDRVFSCLAESVDYTGPWTEHFRSAIRSLL